MYIMKLYFNIRRNPGALIPGFRHCLNIDMQISLHPIPKGIFHLLHPGYDLR